MGMGWNWKEWLKAAGIRAVKTFAQTMVGSIAVGAAVSEIDWLRMLSVSASEERYVRSACVLLMQKNRSSAPSTHKKVCSAQ